MLNNVNNKYNNNVNNNVTSKSRDNHRKVEDIATQLVEKLNSPNSYKLFCQIAYKNTEQLIWRLVGEVNERQSVRNRAGYFVSLIKIYGEL